MQAVSAIGDVLELNPALFGELHKCAVFVLLPSGIVVKIVEDDDRPRNDFPTQMVKHGLRRGIQIAIDVDERAGSLVVFDKRRKRFVEPSFDEAHVAPRCRKPASERILSLGVTRPVFRKSFEAIETVNHSRWMVFRDKIDAVARKNTKLQQKPRVVHLLIAENVLHHLEPIVKAGCLQEVLHGKFRRLPLGNPVHDGL